LPRVAQTKTKRKKPSERVASGDGDGFETISSVGVGENTRGHDMRRYRIRLYVGMVWYYGVVE
jgi:hypothetical protein